MICYVISTEGNYKLKGKAGRYIKSCISGNLRILFGNDLFAWSLGGADADKRALGVIFRLDVVMGETCEI